MDPKLVTPFIMGALVIWVIYRRLRRSFGRQTVNVGMMWLRIGILALVGALVTYSSMHSTAALEALFGGLVCGLALAYMGIRHTRFEVTAQGRFYTPHTYIGLFVTAIFLGRLLYRYVTLYTARQAAPAPNQNVLAAFQQNPLTLGIFSLLIGYYLFFGLGVLQRTRMPTAAAAEPESQ